MSPWHVVSVRSCHICCFVGQVSVAQIGLNPALIVDIASMQPPVAKIAIVMFVFGCLAAFLIFAIDD